MKILLLKNDYIHRFQALSSDASLASIGTQHKHRWETQIHDLKYMPPSPLSPFLDHISRLISGLICLVWLSAVRSGVISAFVTIRREQGVAGYWRGLTAFLPRVCIYSGVQGTRKCRRPTTNLLGENRWKSVKIGENLHSCDLRRGQRVRTDAWCTYSVMH